MANNDEVLYYNPESGAHAHMTDAGEKICRDTKGCPVWAAYDDFQDEIAALEDEFDSYQMRREQQHEDYLDSLDCN